MIFQPRILTSARNQIHLLLFDLEKKKIKGSEYVSQDWMICIIMAETLSSGKIIIELEINLHV